MKDRAALRMMHDALADGRAHARTRSSSTRRAATPASPTRSSAPRSAYRVRARDAVERDQGAQGHRAGVRHRDHLQRSDGGLRRRDPPRAQDRRRETRRRYFYPDQYSNPDNPLAHYHGTGREILDARRRSHHALRRRPRHERHDDGHVAAPAASTRARSAASPSSRRTPLHGLEGLKHMPSSLVPAIYDASGYDETMRVTTEDGWDMADRLAREEALHVGHSSRRRPSSRPSRSPKKLHAKQGGGLRRDHRLRSRRPLLRADEMGEAVRLVNADRSLDARRPRDHARRARRRRGGRAARLRDATRRLRLPARPRRRRALLCDEHVPHDERREQAPRARSGDATSARRARSSRSTRRSSTTPCARRRPTGDPVKVLYHSHLDAGAYFSPTDAAVMSMGEPPAHEGGADRDGPGPGVAARVPRDERPRGRDRRAPALRLGRRGAAVRLVDELHRRSTD